MTEHEKQDKKLRVDIARIMRPKKKVIRKVGLNTAQKLFRKVVSEITFFDFISEYTQLKKTASSYSFSWRFKCLFCPNDEYQSAFLNSRGLNFECIECGKEGNVIDFISYIRDCDPMDAATYLAKKLKFISDENED